MATLHAEGDPAKKRKAKEEDEAPEELGLAYHTSRNSCDCTIAERTGRVTGIVHDVVDGCRVSCNCICWISWNDVRTSLCVHRIGLDDRSGRRQVDRLRLIRLLRPIVWVVLHIVIVIVVGLWSVIH